MPKGVQIDGERIARLRNEKPWTQETLAEKTGLSPRAIQAIETTGTASATSVKLIADALEVPSTRLLTTYREIVLPGNIRDYLTAEQSRVLDVIEKIANMTDGMDNKGAAEGSVRITVKLSEEDAAKLDAAFRDGKLKHLNVLGVEKPRRWWQKPRSHRAASLVASILSLLCSLSVFLPVWRVPYFAIGLLLGLIGGVLGCRRRYLVVAASVVLVANIVGWSSQFVFPQKYPITVSRYGHGKLSRVNDVIVLKVDGEIRFTAKIIERPQNLGDYPNELMINSGDNAITVDAGRHSVEYILNGKSVFIVVVDFGELDGKSRNYNLEWGDPP